MNKKIQELITAGEGYKCEFKERPDKTLIEEVCAFANASGGKILLGVADDGTVQGTDTSNKARSQIQDTVNKLEPKLNIKMETEDDVMVLDVPNGEDKPYSCSGSFFMRMGANTQKLEGNEIINFYKSEGRIQFDALVNRKADFENDFDERAFERFLTLAGITPQIATENLLQNLDCLTSDKQMTNLGVLFFAKDIDFIMNHALVDCILFHGDERVKILNRRQYKGNMLENIDNALSFIEKHTDVEYVITGNPRREEIPDYPEEALREAIVNAVCHRDYFIRESNVVIEVFRNQVKISNPGGLPKGLNPEKFGTQSFPRNQLIAAMLHRANYIEKAGTGIKRMRSASENHKKKVKIDFEYDESDIFYSVIFTRAAQEESQTAAQGVKEETGRSDDAKDLGSKNGLADSQQKIIELMLENSAVTKQEMAEAIGISDTAVDKNINALRKKGFIKRVGPAKFGRWEVVKK